MKIPFLKGLLPWRALAALMLASVAGSAITACESNDDNLAAPAAAKIAVPANCKADADCAAPANSCFAAKCQAGQCLAAAVKDGTACDDGNVCNSEDVCAKGVCKGGSDVKKCDDGDTCTDDACDSHVGCVFTALVSKCDDGNPCTDDACAKSACKNTPNDTSKCDDDNQCTVGDKCAAGKCQPGKAPDCDDGNVCTTDSCDEDLGCIGKNNTAPCTDNNACTKGDECLDGECRAGKTAVSCDDNNACTEDACDKAKGCVNASAGDGKACTDGDACTDSDICKAGKCAAGAPLACNDNDVCSDDACDKVKGCTHASNTAKCEDGDVCTEGDACAAGKCAAGKAKNCDDANTCTADSCDPKLGCQLAATASACDDQNACTTGDACKDKSCAAGAGKPDCDDKNPCTDDACDPKTGCMHTNNTAACDDGDAKTVGDVCAAGKCAGKLPSDPTPTCTAYCDTITANCTAGNAQYANKADCVLWCEDLAMWAPGAAGDKAGNTIGCRSYHAGAAKADPTLHCPHAGPTGGNVCGSWCDNYCALASMNCSGALGYKNNGDCMSTCAKAPVNSAAGDKTGYSVQCMIGQGGLAGNDPTLCQSMTVSDGGVGACKVPPKTTKIKTENFAFLPADVTIGTGELIEFSLEPQHNVVEVSKADWDANKTTAKAGGFSVGFGATKAVGPFAAGTYYYVCEPHGAGGMKGKFTVK